MPYSEQERKRQASIKLKELRANAKKIGKVVNINVERDLVAAHLSRKNLFRNFDSAKKWATDWMFDHG